MSYADTSFIAACYLDDEQTGIAAAYLKQHGLRLPFIFLHWPELAKAIAAKSPNAEKDWDDLKTDIFAGKKLLQVEIDCNRVGRRAAGLLLNFHPRWNKLRSLDAMHVAAAVEGGYKTFLSFDAGSYQRVLASTQKLSVWPPLTSEEKARLK